MPEENQSQSTPQSSQPATPASPPPAAPPPAEAPLPPLTITQNPVIAVKSGDKPASNAPQQNKE